VFGSALNNPVQIASNNSVVGTFTSTGLGIGVTPTQRLDVATASGDCIIRLGNGTSTARFAVDNDGPYIYALTSGDNALRVFTPAGGTAMTLDASGNLLVGTTTSNTGNINGSVFYGGADAGIIYLQRQTGTDQMRFYVGGNRIGQLNTGSSVLTLGTANYPLAFSTNDAERARITSGGNFGIGTTNPLDKLEINGNDKAIALTVGGGAGNEYGGRWRVYDTGAGVYTSFDTKNVGSWTNNRFTILSSSGNVGIGTTTPGYKLEVNGSFAATTKSFIIDHPTKPGMKLRYGSLEGPENGVYIRGKSSSYTIELPDYWTKLVDPESITVQITPYGAPQNIWVSSIADNTVRIASDTPICTYFYFIQAERIDVEKLEVEI
jgi:hypothetical protein